MGGMSNRLAVELNKSSTSRRTIRRNPSKVRSPDESKSLAKKSRILIDRLEQEGQYTITATRTINSLYKNIDQEKPRLARN